MDLYPQVLMDHYENPRNQGNLIGDDIITSKDSNATCGDVVQFYLKVKNGIIIEVKWEGTGCAITTASASKLSEFIKAKKIDDIKNMDENELVKIGINFEVNPGRLKCLTLPVRVIKQILS